MPWGGGSSWLWVWSRVANVILGALFASAGLRLVVSGGAGWCPFRDMPSVVTNIIGVGLVVGGVLLLPARSAVVGLGFVGVWLILWVSMPRTFWGNESCWQTPLALAALSLNMGLMGFSDRGGRSQPDTRTLLSFALAYLIGATVLWLRR